MWLKNNDTLFKEFTELVAEYNNEIKFVRYKLSIEDICSKITVKKGNETDFLNNLCPQIIESLDELAE